MTHTTRSTCRLCGRFDLETVLDLGSQCLTGQFPTDDEPDPPSVPVEIVRCPDCGLLQQRHTVDPAAMFTSYFYRSSVSATMKDHLKQLAEEAAAMIRGRVGEVCVAPRILDIGGNDGWTLDCFPDPTGQRTVLDPSDVPLVHNGIVKVRDFFPSSQIANKKYDIIFMVACLYDADAPVAWARAVKNILAPGGLWVVEVADAASILKNVDYCYWCSEHNTALDLHAINDMVKQVDMKIVRVETNGSNGGSIRCYIASGWQDHYDHNMGWMIKVGDAWSASQEIALDRSHSQQFAKAALANISVIVQTLEALRQHGRRVHLLAASTKSGVALQAGKIDRSYIEAASDRDPRKVGRRMPGTGIPIVSEELSRRMRPDVYFSLMPKSFRQELVERERAAGAKAEIVFGDGERHVL